MSNKTYDLLIGLDTFIVTLGILGFSWIVLIAVDKAAARKRSEEIYRLEIKEIEANAHMKLSDMIIDLNETILSLKEQL
jgi:hypothetical protein